MNMCAYMRTSVYLHMCVSMPVCANDSKYSYIFDTEELVLCGIFLRV